MTAGESTQFIEFMLSVIHASLMEAVNVSDEMSDGPQSKAALRWQKIQAYLKSHETIQSADVQRLCARFSRHCGPYSNRTGQGRKAHPLPGGRTLGV